jgi:hypothetical protein
VKGIAISLFASHVLLVLFAINITRSLAVSRMFSSSGLDQHVIYAEASEDGALAVVAGM